MKQRVLAGLGAIALVAAALVLRSQLADDGSAGATRADGTTGTPVVACTPDLQDICDALVDADLIEGTAPFDLAPQRSDGPTAAAPDASVDGWITWDPAPAIANFDAGQARAPEPWSESVLLGSAPLAILARPGGLRALSSCAAADWACVSGADLLLGTGLPTTAEGLARFGPIARAKEALSDGELTSDDVLALRDLVGRPGGQPSAADAGNQLLIKPGAFDAVVGPRPLLDALRRKPQGQSMRLLDVAPQTQIGVVLTPRTGTDLGGLAGDIKGDGAAAAALTEAGVVVGGGELGPEDLAGFLFQVREKVG